MADSVGFRILAATFTSGRVSADQLLPVFNHMMMKSDVTARLLLSERSHQRGRRDPGNEAMIIGIPILLPNPTFICFNP
jgi:hypothetical protein